MNFHRKSQKMKSANKSSKSGGFSVKKSLRNLKEAILPQETNGARIFSKTTKLASKKKTSSQLLEDDSFGDLNINAMIDKATELSIQNDHLGGNMEKIVILGTKNSGKSTLIKHFMRLYRPGGFNAEEKLEAKASLIESLCREVLLLLLESKVHYQEEGENYSNQSQQSLRRSSSQATQSSQLRKISSTQSQQSLKRTRTSSVVIKINRANFHFLEFLEKKMVFNNSQANLDELYEMTGTERKIGDIILSLVQEYSLKTHASDSYAISISERLIQTAYKPSDLDLIHAQNRNQNRVQFEFLRIEKRKEDDEASTNKMNPLKKLISHTRSLSKERIPTNFINNENKNEKTRKRSSSKEVLKRHSSKIGARNRSSSKDSLNWSPNSRDKLEFVKKYTRVVDVGADHAHEFGRATNLSHWMHDISSNQVKTIVYMVACNEYFTRRLRRNSIKLSIDVFLKLANAPNLEDCKFVVLLNKTDLLKHNLVKGIHEFDPNEIFDDSKSFYEKTRDFELVKQYLHQAFREAFHTSRRAASGDLKGNKERLSILNVSMMEDLDSIQSYIENVIMD